MWKKYVYCIFILVMILGCKSVPEPKEVWNYTPEKDKYVNGSYYQNDKSEDYIVVESSFHNLILTDDKAMVLETENGRVKDEININPGMKEDKNLGNVELCHDYLVKFYKDRIDVIQYSSKTLIYSIGIKAEKMLYEINEKKGIIILNKFINSTDKEISIYDLKSGREITNIKYKYKVRKSTFFEKDYYTLFPELNTIWVYAVNEVEDTDDENTGFNFKLENNILVYDIITGEKLSTINNIVDIDNLYLIDSDKEEIKYLITKKPNIFREINVKTGKILCELNINKNKKAGIGFQAEKFGDLVYLTNQDDKNLKENGIVCIDEKEKKVLWNKKLITSHFINVLESGDDIITYDNKNVFRLDKKSGNEIWKTDLLNSKVLLRNSIGLFVGMGMGNTRKLSEELGYSGFALLNEKTGEKIWSFNTKKSMYIPDVFKHTKKDSIYFVEGKTFYILDMKTGKIIDENILKLDEDASSSLFLEDRNRMMIFTRDYIYSYDIDKKIINYEIDIDELNCDYFMFDSKVINNYLIFTSINPGIEFNGRTYSGEVNRLLINIDSGEIIWKKRIGDNYFTGSNGLYYYLKYGDVPSMFYPRKDILEKNRFIIDPPYSPVTCYSFFPAENIPTKKDFENSKSRIGIERKITMSSLIKKFAVTISSFLWKD
jgi:outer membrane protein assembly factor BamB